jgi:hypothetical protein
MGYYPLLGYTHKYMGDWCEFYYVYYKYCSQTRSKNLEKCLGDLIGHDNLQFISPHYHYEKAREAFFAGMELHKEGKAYKDFIHKMYYLNDDFNDTTYHYFAAEERYRINIGHISKNLLALKKRRGVSDLYKYESYVRGLNLSGEFEDE